MEGNLKLGFFIWWESQKEKQDGSWVGMDWIGLAQDRDQWRALVNGVMNLWVP
jgi:hypothetical protein